MGTRIVYGSGNDAIVHRGGAMAVLQNAKDWQEGYVAALQGGKPDECPAAIIDRLAWSSGFIEGKAAAERLERAARSFFEKPSENRCPS